VRTIIAGSRCFTLYSSVDDAVKASGFKISEVVSGTAPGIDTLGEEWAEQNGVMLRRFPANWTDFGKRAGTMRNEKMGDYAQALIAVWDGESPGTRHMIGYARMRRLYVYVHLIQEPDYY
jgi:hypothetical protein